MMHRRKTQSATMASRLEQALQAGLKGFGFGVFPRFIEILMNVGVGWHGLCVVSSATAP